MDTTEQLTHRSTSIYKANTDIKGEIDSNTTIVENRTAMCKRKGLEYFLIPYTKINSKWIKDLHVRPETIKLLEKNTGRTLDDIYQSKILYDSPPRVMEIKAKINKWDLMKLKSFLHSKGNYKQGEKTTLRMGENNSKGNN